MGNGKKTKIKEYNKDGNGLVYGILIVGVLIVAISFGIATFGKEEDSNNVVSGNGSNIESNDSTPPQINNEATEIDSALKKFIKLESIKVIEGYTGESDLLFPTEDDFYLIVKTTSDKKDEGYTRYTVNSYYTINEENPKENPNREFIVVLDIKSENDPVYNIGVFLK